MIGLGIGGLLVALLGCVIWALVRRATKGAVSKHRADALDANLEATNEAERHLDEGEVSLEKRRARAARRRLRRRGGS